MEAKPGSWELTPGPLRFLLHVHPSPTSLGNHTPSAPMVASAPAQHGLSEPELTITGELVLVSFRLTHPLNPGGLARLPESRGPCGQQALWARGGGWGEWGSLSEEGLMVG